jgi:competence protein ComEC
VILAAPAEAAPEGCRLIDAKMLAATGPLAVWITEDGIAFERTRVAHRLWSPPVREVNLPDLTVKPVALAGQ